MRKEIGMANVWRVFEGREPTVGGPWIAIPLLDAVEALDLRAGDLIGELDETPRFGDKKRDLRFAGFKHVVVEVEDSEARQAKWRPGFYKSRLAPAEAFGRLIQQAIASELRADNVVRVEVGSTTDSLGQDALKVTVVLAPGALERLDGRSVLDAAVAAQRRLRELKDDRVALVDYATEAELVEDGSRQS